VEKVAEKVAVSTAPKYAGGAYGKLDRAAGLERHHMPADSVSPIARACGPAIQMDAADHALTSSYGNSARAQAYREESVPSLRREDSVMPWPGE
jgi:hypothetical protein